MIWIVFYAGIAIGGVIGVLIMCLFQINNTHKSQNNEEKE